MTGIAELSEGAMIEGVSAMPWTPDDAPSHTKKATSPKAKRLWTEIANKVLAETGDEGRAIREANAVIARATRKSDPAR